MASRPQHVGILAMEIYVPPTFVSQTDLEAFDGASAGKYTVGLGQDELGFCCDNEDVISMSLTAVQRLLEQSGVDPSQVGRLEVGSETVVDKSKSIKTVIMRLFEDSGNADVAGVDSCNACYGGTAALLNSINWVEGSCWDGRYAVVVAADSAVYSPGPARPTGGAGAVALLVGPNAPLVMEGGVLASYAAHEYDFYKPRMSSEYPLVDGKLSQTCYVRALDRCYEGYCRKFEQQHQAPFSLALAAAVVFHSPYNKLVQKCLARLVFNDAKRGDASSTYLSPSDTAALQPFFDMPEEMTLVNRELEKVAMRVAQPVYASKLEATAMVGKRVGNMYCASLYGALASLVTLRGTELMSRRIVLFSYGSGLMSTMFSLTVRAAPAPFTIEAMANNLNVHKLLATRTKVPASEFASTMDLMETIYGACSFIPSTPINRLQPGAYYLTAVDDLYRRTYARKGKIEVANGAAEHGSMANGSVVYTGNLVG